MILVTSAQGSIRCQRINHMQEANMEFLLRGFIFHKIETEQHQKEVFLDPRKTEVQLPDDKANSLVKSILSSYQGEGNMAYAKTLEDSWFDSKSRKYYSQDISFYDYSIEALKSLKTEMEKEPASTGGFLTIIDYLLEDEPNLMVILIKNAKGIGINDDMELEEIDTLDIDKLHFAANINVNRWLKIKDIEAAHVSFLKGKNRRDTVVGYFKTFLGINEDDYIDPTKHTQQLVSAIKNYCESYKNEEEALISRRAIQEWADKRAEDEQPITLIEIANLIEPGDPQNFINYITETKLEIPAEFTPVRKHLKQLIRYRVQGPDKEYTLSFEQSALENKTIYQNAQGHLVITKVPDAILQNIPKMG